MNSANTYRTLGLQQGAAREEIRKAYHRLALKYHPDKVKKEKEKKRATHQFREIQRAYEILSEDAEEDSQPSLESLKRKREKNREQDQNDAPSAKKFRYDASSHWFEYDYSSAEKSKYKAYVEGEVDEESKERIDYEPVPDDEEEYDYDNADLQKPEDSNGDEEKAKTRPSWVPSAAMLTTGFSGDDPGLEKYYAAKMPKKLAITDGTVEDTLDEEWESFQKTVENTPFVFEPPPLRKIAYSGAIVTTFASTSLLRKEEVAPFRPPEKSNYEFGEAISMRVMPKYAKVVGVAKDGKPIHEGDDLNPKEMPLTAADYNRQRLPEPSGPTIAAGVKWRTASTRELRVIRCQVCFQGGGHWTLEEREL